MSLYMYVEGGRMIRFIPHTLRNILPAPQPNAIQVAQRRVLLLLYAAAVGAGLQAPRKHTRWGARH